MGEDPIDNALGGEDAASSSRRISQEQGGWDEESQAALRLLMVDGVGQARLRALQAGFGGFVAALAASPSEFAEVIGVDSLRARRMLQEAARIELGRALAVLERQRIRPVLEVDSAPSLASGTSSSSGYPSLLLASHDPPALLFVRGELRAPPEPAVAIVGSRRASPYGRLHAGRLAAGLAERGVTVVSGGARGIDAEAHRGALRAGGRTIAVLATGASNPYPDDHIGLFDAIVEGGGCTVGEQPPPVSVRADLFPRRNRLIAALSLVTVVVEAANRSGALLTARIAVDDLGREAACLPGPADSVTSEGCHRAVREGWAHLVTSADDVHALVEQAWSIAAGARELAGRAQATRSERAARAPAHATGLTRASSGAIESIESKIGDDARRVLESIRAAGSAGLDELEMALAWTIPRIATAALELEVAGAIERDAQGAFVSRGRRQRA